MTAWLAAPLLFAVSVLGLTAIGGALLSAPWQATLSSALWGAAAAITAALAGAVAWRSPSQRAALAIPYPLTLLLAGLALDDVRVPTRWAGTLGVLAIAALLVFYQRRRTM